MEKSLIGKGPGSASILFSSQPIKHFISLEQGAKGRGEQRRRLRTKALMRDLGTRLECRQRAFVKTGKTLCK